MKIYDTIKFEKYLAQPVRVKSMGKNMAAVAEGALLATFESIEELRNYFPYGKHKEL